MNLIALRGSHNTPALRRMVVFAAGYEHIDKNGGEITGKDGLPRHRNAINKGDRFSIDGALPMARMQDEEEKKQVRRLMAMDIVASTDGDEGKRLCDEIDAEVKAETKQQTDAKTAKASGSQEELVATAVAAAMQSVVPMLLATGWTPPATAKAAKAALTEAAATV